MGESVGAGDLAELLRELKERSGLSYGALAKRLHMSTSTLHRYVKGAAVPTEFAPLERLARVCGASRDEMVEVHRRWILADAYRGDRKEGESASGAESRAGGGGEGAAGSGGAGSVGSLGDGSAPGAPGAPASGTPASDAPATKEPATKEPATKEPAAKEPATTRPAPPASPSGTPPPTHPRSGDPDAAEPGDEAPDIVIGPAPAGADRAAGRRLTRARVLVAAGVVMALGATAVAVHAASDGGKRERASVNSPSAQDGEWGGSPAATGSASPSGKPSEKGKPGKGATRSAGPGSEEKAGKDKTGGAPGTGDGGKGGGAADGGKAGVPVSISTQPHYWSGGCGGPYLVDKEPGELSPPPGEQDAPAWASANDAVAARDQAVRFTVQGKGKEAVVLESLNVRVAGTGEPLKWTNYKTAYLGVGCGSGVPKHSFATDLDAAAPRLTPEEGDEGFPYKVSANDPEAFYVNASVNTRFVRWYLELTWSSGGRRGTIRIDDEGKPFATSGDQDRPVYAFSLNSKKWTRTNRDDDNVPDPPA
ncbi:helix-turn-helix domain-containing protein [Streptomyces sp. NPDC059002]|uniref:transcriptional regulator n=1 Tax=Streptomyces sp. NPDC059002 TaxID=3346690 RepID=UPI0036AECC87